jgi:two-component system, NarL family, response regulator DevR
MTNSVPDDKSSSLEPIRVFLLDDHEVVREGVRLLLQSAGDIVVVGDASRCSDVLPRVAATNPMVAILDVQLPDGSGVEVCRDIRSAFPHVGCLMLTSFSDDEAMFQAVLAGASGFVLKQVRGIDLAATVRKVAAGESLIDPLLMTKLLNRIRKPEEQQDPKLRSLTKLERSILDLVAEGMTNRQIAGELHIAEKTVKNYMSSVLLKLGFTRRTEAAVFAVKAAASKTAQL